MPIIDDVTDQMKTAMRAKDKVRLGALRGIRAAFIEAMKADGSETVPDAAAITILRRLEKQRKESISAYEQGGREDLASVEREELAVLQDFLPSLADEATTRTWVQAAIEQSGAAGPQDMGRVMGEVMSELKGKADGNRVRVVVQELLKG